MTRTFLPFMAVVAALSVPGQALAVTQVFDISVVDPAAGLLAGPYGTVSVTEDSGSLIFTETLNAGFRIHDGNSNHNAFAFSLVGAPVITLSNLTAGFALLAGPVSAPPFANGGTTFNYGIDCVTCGPGYPGGNAGPLTFKVSSAGLTLTLASLSPITYASQNIYFATDLVDRNGKTGNVGAVGGGAVPEPASWAMMIAGFGLAGFALRRNRAERSLLAGA